MKDYDIFFGAPFHLVSLMKVFAHSFTHVTSDFVSVVSAAGFVSFISFVSVMGLPSRLAFSAASFFAFSSASFLAFSAAILCFSARVWKTGYLGALETLAWISKNLCQG